MLTLQIAAIILIAFIALVIHRAGVPRSLRAIGVSFFAVAFAWESARAEMKRRFAEGMADVERITQ